MAVRYDTRNPMIRCDSAVACSSARIRMIVDAAIILVVSIVVCVRIMLTLA